MEPGLVLAGANASLGSRKVVLQHPRTLHCESHGEAMNAPSGFLTEVFSKRAIYLHQPGASHQEDEAQVSRIIQRVAEGGMERARAGKLDSSWGPGC